MDLKTLYKISYGMYIVCSKDDGKGNGQIANTVFQITSEPPTLAVSINKQNLTHEYISASKAFTVSILTKETPMEFIGRFGFRSGRDFDKLEGIKTRTGNSGIPVIDENCLGYIECEVINSLDCGTHTIFIGKITEAQITGKGEPMTYAYYHEIKKGVAPKAAPTYIKEG